MPPTSFEFQLPNRMLCQKAVSPPSDGRSRQIMFCLPTERYLGTTYSKWAGTASRAVMTGTADDKQLHCSSVWHSLRDGQTAERQPLLSLRPYPPTLARRSGHACSPYSIRVHNRTDRRCHRQSARQRVRASSAMGGAFSPKKEFSRNLRCKSPTGPAC